VLRALDNVTTWPQEIPLDAPPISTIQQVIDQDVMPKIEEVLDHVRAIEQHPEFHKPITAITGYGFVGILTTVEIHALDAMLLALRAALDVVNGYHLDVDYEAIQAPHFDAQDYLDSVNTTFLTHKPDILTRMASAKQDLGDASAHLRSAVAAWKDNAEGFVAAFFEQSGGPVLQDYLTRWMDVLDAALAGPVDVPVNVFNPDDGVVFRGDLAAVAADPPQRTDLPQFHVSNPAEEDWQNVVTEMTFQDPTFNAALPLMTDGEFSGFVSRELVTYLHELFKGGQFGFIMKLLRLDIGVGLVITTCDWERAGIRIEWEPVDAFDGLLDGFIRYEVFRSTASPCDRNRSAAEWNNGLTLVATVTDINTMTALDQTVAQNGAKYHYKVYAVLDNGVIIRSDQRTVLTDDYIGRNWHVDDSNRSGIEDGTARYPFTSLLRALNNAGSGDVVKVAAGTYRDMAGATGKIVYLQGGYAGAPSYNGATEGDFSETARSLDRVQNATVLDGEGLHRLLTFGKDVMGGGGAGGAVSGFIVRDCWENRSGALNCEEETDLLVHHCTFVNNGINDGGGAIACDDETTLTVEDCSFENNGGGIRCDDDCTVTLRRCRFDTTYGSAAVKLYEGGELTAVDCLFTHCNTVGNDDGAAATSFWETAMAFDGCTFTANRADSGGAVAPGYLGTLVATNCLFAGNRAEGRGGALAVDRADVTVRNCTFAENRAPSAGAVYFKVGSMVLADSILWGNRARSLAVSQVSSESFALTISHCLIEGGTQTITCTDGGGNADLDPHFARLGVWIDVDRWTAGDYHLLSAEGRYRPALGLPPADPSAWTADEWTSPAIDAASPAADVRNEPQENGGRANAGRFGTTEQASKSRLQLPSRVTGVEASKGAFPTHVHIHWDGAAGADSYEIYRHETDDHRAATRIGTTPNPEFDDGNALPGTIYLYWIAAVNTAGRAIHSRSSVGFAGALGSGMMLSTGDNWAYQLGDGSREERHRPVPIRDLLGFVQVAADESATIALAGDGSVWVWGTNSKGQFANENLDSSAIPVRVQGLSGIRAIAARSGQCLALTQTGTVLGWGLFLADTGGRAEILHAPTPVPGLTDVVGIAAGNAQALAVKQNGTVWGWGGNGSGEVGMDPQTVWYVTAPTQIPNVADIQAVSAGRAFSLALTRTGTVLAWGRNSDQELGDGTSADRWQPAPVNGLADIVRISAGATHSLALTGSRTVWAWGNNRGGQLGLGAASLPRQPTLIPALSDVADISAGTGINWYDGFSAAVKRDGTVWAWGRNTYGQLGNNSSAHTAAPVQMDVARNAYHVSAGTSHTVVLTAPVFFVNDADTTGDRFCTAPGNPANNGLSAATPKASLAGLLAGIIPPPGAVVRVDTGTYVLDSPVLFSALNSGEAGSDVQIRGAGRAYSIFIPGTGRGPDSAVRLDACHDIYIAGIGFAAFPSAVAGNAGSGVTVSACAMLNCTGNAVDIEGAGELRLIGNRIADGAGAGIVLRNCAEALVASNIAANTAQPGLDILEGNARIVGNSFVDNGVANIRTTGKIHQAGNIFSQTGSGNWCVFVPDPADLLSSDYNLFNPSDGALLGRHAGPRIDLAAWQTSTAGDEHSVQADPMFAAPAEGDWTLQSYSPCIDASLGLPADAPRDADGNPRYDDEHVPNTGAGTPAFVDIGALERQNNSGEIFRVDGSARPGGDGKTWKTAFQTIEDAILAAQDGDSLWIAHWPMHEKLPVSKALRLYGGFEGGETAASERKLWRRRTIVIGPATAEGAVVAVNNAGNVLLDGFLLTALHNTDRRDDANGLFVANGTGMTTVRNCTIVSCFAESGGGVRCIDSDLRVENCEIVGNAALTGGGVSCEGSSTVLLLNCTLSGNTAQTGGGIAAREGAVDLVNSIVYANSAATSGPEIDVGTAAVSVHYSCVGDAAYCSREGNICASPGFRLLGQWVDPGTPADPFDDTWTQGVYHLARNSPCIDAADATAAAAQDLNGMPRFDDPETPNTGLPRAAFSDMGAHEYQGYSNLQLHAGWNLVALRRQPVPDSPTLTFADYSTRNAVFSGRVWAWNGMMQNYRHVVNVDPLCGLWLFCEADVTIQIYGRDIGDDTEPQLGRNWELPGFARPTELLEIPGMRGPGWGWDPVGQQYMPETRTCQPCAAYWILCR
jgi:alpha-tubulin suppressor-like RCC1 family protein